MPDESVWSRQYVFSHILHSSPCHSQQHRLMNIQSRSPTTQRIYASTKLSILWTAMMAACGTTFPLRTARLSKMLSAIWVAAALLALSCIAHPASTVKTRSMDAIGRSNPCVIAWAVSSLSSVEGFRVAEMRSAFDVGYRSPGEHVSHTDAMRHMERVDFGYQDVPIYINFGDIWT